MIDSIFNSSYEEADAVVIGVPYGHSASFGKGAENGPAGIKDMLDSQLELFDRYTEEIPISNRKLGYLELEQVAELSLKNMVLKVEEVLSAESRFIVLLGGVHSVSIPAFRALAKKHNPREVTILQIDAHFDLRKDDSDYNKVDPSEFAHSTVMRHACELGFSILPVGIRTMYEGEFTYARENKITYFEWGRFDKPTPSVNQVIDSISTDLVYLTLDVDGFDPSIMPDTGTPIPGGLSWEYGNELIRTLFSKKNVVGADVVEVSPASPNRLTEYSAAQLVYYMMGMATL